MITPDEIDASAETLGINRVNVQRDYLFGWVIAGVFGSSSIGDQLVLKGGNALRKGYFSTTRFSDDLDFSTAHAIDENRLLSELNEVCRLAASKTGVTFEIDRNRILDHRAIEKGKYLYKLCLYFRDFYGNQDHAIVKLRVDVTEFDRLYLAPQTRRLVHPYSDIDQCATDIRVVKLEEALADKLKCLLQRQSSYDLYDLVHAIFISKDIDVDRSEIVGTFLKKTIFESSPVAAKNLLLGVPYDIFRAYWDKIVCPKGSLPKFTTALSWFKDGLESLFAPFSYGHHQELLFFPAELRNQIFEAARTRTLLQVTYDGATRLVEPYSLTFKRRKDGVGQEYFFAWDQTGGNSGPGIKMFFHWKMRAVQNTDTKFDPQFEIEIAKSGEHSNTGYFQGSFRGRRSSTTRRRAIYTGVQYKVRCGYCNRVFTRKTRTTSLRPHKDGYGNPCYGRRGYLD